MQRICFQSWCWLKLCAILFPLSALADVQQSKRSDSSARGNDNRTIPSQRTRSDEELSLPQGKPSYTPIDAIAVDPKKERKKDIDSYEIFQKDFKDFFGQVEQRFRNVVKKRHIFIHGEPYTIQGIPIVFNSFTSGFNMGIRLALFNISREDPYKAGIQLQYWESDLGRKNHRIGLDFPHIFDSAWRLKLNTDVVASVTETYVGVGTMGVPDYTKRDPSHPDFLGLRYYDFRREGVGVAVKTTRQILESPLYLEGAIAYEYTRIAASSEGAPQQIFSERPVGIEGGRTPYFGVGFAYDTRDFEPYPSSGHFSEFFVTHHAESLGSDYLFTRYTFNDRHYASLRPKVILAHLMTFEGITGQAPYYKLGLVGGLDQRDVSGGQYAMRGFNGMRFLGHYKWVQQLEIRYEFGQANWWRQRFDFSFAPHIDIIRAWDKDEPFEFNRFVVSGGWGIRARWNRIFVMRADFGFSRENQLLQLGVGNTF